MDTKSRPRCSTLSALAATLLFIVVGFLDAPASSGQENGNAVLHAKSLSRAFRGAAEAASPSVVTIIAKSKPLMLGRGGDIRDLMKDPRFRQLFPEGQLPFDIPEGNDEPGEPALPELESNIGSGIILDASGIILTNAHVVHQAEEVLVRLPGGREVKADEIKTDPMSDVAIIKIKDAGPLTAARIGDADNLEIGDWVIAIGSPFELEATVSAGIISGKGRIIHQIRRGKLLQTDAAINPGNSGGPLVNLDGEVVGINAAIATNNGGYQGIGFAIPINRARWVADELVKHGQVRRAYLGIRIDEITPDTAKRLGVQLRSGVLVVEVLPGTPAAEAGIKPDDLIVEFASERVRDPRDLQDVVEQKPLGSRQKVQVIREGKPTTLQVSVAALALEAAQPQRPAPENPVPQE